MQRGAAGLLAAFLRRGGGHFQPGLGGQLLDRLGEAEMAGPHFKADGVAVGAAPKTVKKALVLVDGEAGGLFVMEGTQAVMLASLLDQLDAPPHHRRQKDAGAEFVEEAGREGHAEP